MDYLLDSKEDMQWLNDTCLNSIKLPDEWVDFKSAIVMGNMDSPHAVKLFITKVPLMVSDYLYLDFVGDEMVHYNGITDQPFKIYPSVSESV